MTIMIRIRLLVPVDLCLRRLWIISKPEPETLIFAQLRMVSMDRLNRPSAWDARMTIGKTLRNMKYAMVAAAP